jgi:hypothetical protein
VSSKSPVIEWDVLPLYALTKPKLSEKNLFPATDLPLEWVLEGPSETGVPMLSFNFPPPLRQYGGEIKDCSGTIQLQKINQLQNMQGSFEVQVTSVDMGEESLSSAVKSSMLYTDKYPTASLIFESVDNLDQKLQLGKISNCQVKAKLTIMNKTHRLTAMSSFEPLLDDAGLPFLVVSTAFEINDLTGMYDIIGPDGPETSNNRLLFRANFRMVATSTDQ